MRTAVGQIWPRILSRPVSIPKMGTFSDGTFSDRTLSDGMFSDGMWDV